MATSNTKRIIAAAETAMGARHGKRVVSDQSPEEVRYLSECLDGKHPEQYPPERVAAILAHMESFL
jgi:hypothetical protein